MKGEGRLVLLVTSPLASSTAANLASPNSTTNLDRWIGWRIMSSAFWLVIVNHEEFHSKFQSLVAGGSREPFTWKDSLDINLEIYFRHTCVYGVNGFLSMKSSFPVCRCFFYRLTNRQFLEALEVKCQRS